MVSKPLSVALLITLTLSSISLSSTLFLLPYDDDTMSAAAALVARIDMMPIAIAVMTPLFSLHPV
jgi:hypothetical protein